MTEAPIALLYRRYFPIIRAKCARILGHGGDAEDVAQETFIRLWRAGMTHEEERAVTAWIYRTATRASIDRIRERGRRLRLHDGGAESAPAAPMGGHPESILGARRELLRIAREAPTDELEVAVMSRLDRMTQPEIALVIGASERTVRRLLDRFDGRLAALAREDTP